MQGHAGIMSPTGNEMNILNSAGDAEDEAGMSGHGAYLINSGKQDKFQSSSRNNKFGGTDVTGRTKNSTQAITSAVFSSPH